MRKLDLSHFAFLRAVLQGIALEDAWDRYLSLETERRDRRVMRSVLGWIRHSLRLVACRAGRPALGRLVRVEVPGGTPQGAAPTLEAFMAERGLEDWGEAEILELYAEAYPQSRRERRAAALLRRQLDALRWLQQLSYEAPRPDDGVRAWFAESLALRLEAAELGSLGALLQRIQQRPGRWWRGIAGIGETKASRIQRWIEGHADTLGSVEAAHGPATGAASQVVPYERLSLPPELDGRDGRLRAPASQCLLDAGDDLQAVGAWLAQHAGQAHTWRAYRREAERFMLWCVLARGKALSSMAREDAIAYRDFLQAPQPAAMWCGARGRPRWSSEWRPFEGALSAGAVRQAVQILHNMYAFLVDQGYVVGNPFSGLPLPRTPDRARRTRRRALTATEWAWVLNCLDASQPQGRRLRALFELLYATGLRLSGVAAARWGALEFVDEPGQGRGWLLHLSVKGGKEHEVLVPDEVIAALRVHAQDRGVDGPFPAAWQDVPLIGRLAEPGGGRGGRALRSPRQGLAAGTVAELVKAHFEACARRASLTGESAMADKLAAASTHWLRHTHATHALESGVPLEVVRDNLAHASLATTSVYVATERSRRLAAMQSFWKARQGSSQADDTLPQLTSAEGVLP